MAEENGDMRLAIIALTCLFAVFGGILFVVLRMTGGSEEEKLDANQKDKRKRGALDRMQRGDEDGEGAEEEDDDGAGDAGGGRRNDQRDRKRQDRQEAAAAMRQQRQQRDQELNAKQEKYNEKQREKDAAREKLDDAEKKSRDDKEKKEQEEFEKWKEMFTVEAEGVEDGGSADSAPVERFVEYIKVRKVVNLEDLAADFHMRTSAAIDRLKELERIGRISGIFDDRGKFVYITVEEMAGVAEWLKNKGRINRADLVAACNKLVRINPTEEDKARLRREASSAVDALDNAEETTS